MTAIEQTHSEDQAKVEQQLHQLHKDISSVHDEKDKVTRKVEELEIWLQQGTILQCGLYIDSTY